MKKSMSLKYMPPSNSNPKLKIDFNPNEFKVGKSRIDTLPIMPRRSSMGSLRKVEDSVSDNKSQRIIADLNLTIQRLTKENIELRKRLDEQMSLKNQPLKITREK